MITASKNAHLQNLPGLGEEWEPLVRLMDEMHNLVALCRQEKIVYINRAGLDVLGLVDGGEAVGRVFAGFFQDDYAEIGALGLEVFADDENRISLKFKRADGGEAEVDMWVSRLGMAGETTFLVEARDVTAHLRAARALQAREKRLEGIINTVADGIMTVDRLGTIQSFNPAAESIFGFAAKEVVGKNIRILLPDPADHERVFDGATDWSKTLASEQEVTGVRKDGHTFPLELAIRALEQDDQVTFTSIVRDISARKKAEEKIRHLAHHDPLTGLPNRHLLGDRLEQAVERARRAGRPLALMFVDLDKFKPINDTLGHAAGDEVLRCIAMRLKASLRGTDTVARVGGDEFVVLLEGLNRSDEAALVAEKILSALTQPIGVAATECTLGASIGISLFPDHAADSDGLMHCADVVMYDVKRAGRNSYRFYEARQ